VRQEPPVVWTPSHAGNNLSYSQKLALNPDPLIGSNQMNEINQCEKEHDTSGTLVVAPVYRAYYIQLQAELEFSSVPTQQHEKTKRSGHVFGYFRYDPF
jgi:hypothetical protein